MLISGLKGLKSRKIISGADPEKQEREGGGGGGRKKFSERATSLHTHNT